MKAVTAARFGLRLGGAGRWDWRPLLGPVAVLAVGFLLTVALSFPAVLVPGTRVGAMLAGALIAGALAGRGKSPWARAASGGLMGLLLGAALSVAAWGLLGDAPDAALWQVTGVNIVANSNIRPVDAGLGSWLGGANQFENGLLYVRFAASSLLLGLLGGLAGGLLASGKPRRRIDAAALQERSAGDEPPAADGEDQASSVTNGEDQASSVTNGEDQESSVTNGEDQEESSVTDEDDGEGAVPSGGDAESTVTNGEDGGSTILGGGYGGPTAAGRRKMLLWGGGGGVLLIAAVAVIVVVVLIMRGGSLPGGPLSLVPDDASWVQVVDVERFLAGDAPDDSTDDFKDEWEDRLDDIGVSLDDLDTLVQAQGDDGTVLVFGGDLDFEQIRDELDDARYDDDDYQGYVVWDDGDLWVEAAALLDGRGEVVIGSTDAVEGVLKALSRGSRSLLQDDDNDLRRVLERAGQGWVVFALEGCQGAGVRGCEAVGAAVSEGSESYLVETTFAYLFRNERTAESELEDLEDYLDDEFSRDVDIEEVKTDGEFVIVTVSVDEDDWSGVFP